MKNAFNSNKVFILVATLLFLVQLFFDTLNLAHLSPHVTLMIGAIGMIVAIIHSGFKQYFDPKIPSASVWISVCLFGAYIAGGILDKLDVLPLSEDGKAITRTAMTFISQAMPIIIKMVNELDDK